MAHMVEFNLQIPTQSCTETFIIKKVSTGRYRKFSTHLEREKKFEFLCDNRRLLRVINIQKEQLYYIFLIVKLHLVENIHIK